MVRTLEQSGQAQLGPKPASQKYSVYPKQIINNTAVKKSKLSNLDGSTFTIYEILKRVRISRSHVLVLAVYTTIPKMVWQAPGWDQVTISD